MHSHRSYRIAWMIPCAMIAAFTSLFAGGQVVSTSVKESQLVHQVLAGNPDVLAAREKWEAYRQRPAQMRAWEDPMAGVDFERSNTDLTTFSMAEYMLSQSIPISGKNRSEERIAVTEAEAAFQDLRRVELDALSKAQSAAYALATAHAQLAITDENVQLLRQFADISRIRYETGSKGQSDVLMAEVELAKLDLDRADFQKEIADREAELNTLMGRNIDLPVGNPLELRFREVPFTESGATAKALSQRPEILRAQINIRTEQNRLQLARRAWIPDPQLRIEARQMREEFGSGIQEIDTGIFFSIPWVNSRKYSAAVIEAAHGIASAQHELASAQNDASGLIRAQFNAINTAARNYRLYQDKIVPLARQTIESTRADYETDKASFLDLITARRSLQEAQSMAVEQLGKHQIAVAELLGIIGGSERLSGSDYKSVH